jgi:hypothetical protein
MQNKEISVKVAGLAIGLLIAGNAAAFDMGNIMNPSKWMGGDRDNDRYYGYRGGPGYGYPGYGYPGYGYGGYPGWGYGGYPNYGYGGGYPGYRSAPTIVVPGSGSGSSNSAEIQRLQQRIRELEGEVR